MAGGMVALFGAETKMGIEVVLDTVGFDGLLTDADVVFTGEGKIDRQSLEGKVICGVAERAAAKNVPVVAVVGGVDGDISKAYRMGLSAVFTINQMPEDFSVSRYKSAENLAATVDNILRILKI
jgi:glycerate kinase